MDRGTENIYCEDLQVYFTKNTESFVYASSTRNQRIEYLWSRLKKFRLNWWINFLDNQFVQTAFIQSSRMPAFLFFYRLFKQNLMKISRLLYLKVPKKHWICTYLYLDAYQTILLRFRSSSFEDTEPATERCSLNVVAFKY